MLITLALHLILLMFELLVCDKLNSGRHLWILVFIPLIFISIVSIAVCIWAVKHDRSYDVRFYFKLYVKYSKFLMDEYSNITLIPDIYSNMLNIGALGTVSNVTYQQLDTTF